MIRDRAEQAERKEWPARRSASNTSYIPAFYRALHDPSTATELHNLVVVTCLKVASWWKGSFPSESSIINEYKTLCSISWLREKPNIWYCGMATLRMRLPGLLLKMSHQQQSGNTFVQIKSLVSHFIVCRISFESPSPLHRVVADASSNFVAAVERNLKLQL